MVNYQLGKIYMIRCNVSGEKYVGSTTKERLSQRLAGHVSQYKKYQNGVKIYVSSFEIIAGGTYQIELIELCPCNSKDELSRREGEIIRTTDCVNHRVAGRTRAEWKQDHKLDLIESNAQYYQSIKVQRSEDTVTCLCGCIVRRDSLVRHTKTAKHNQWVLDPTYEASGIKPIAYSIN